MRVMVIIVSCWWRLLILCMLHGDLCLVVRVFFHCVWNNWVRPNRQICIWFIDIVLIRHVFTCRENGSEWCFICKKCWCRQLFYKQFSVHVVVYVYLYHRWKWFIECSLRKKVDNSHCVKLVNSNSQFFQAKLYNTNINPPFTQYKFIMKIVMNNGGNSYNY